MSVCCLGEVWLELAADTAPELADGFRAGTGGWSAAFCRRYAAHGGQPVLLAQLGADPFGRKIAAQLAADGVDCTGLSFTGQFPTPVVFTGAGEPPLPYRAGGAGWRWGRSSWTRPFSGRLPPSAFPPPGWWTAPCGWLI